MHQEGRFSNLGVKIEKVTVTKTDVTVDYVDAAGAAQSQKFDRLIVSIGRIPHTAGLNGQSVGLALDERGFVTVDAECRTNVQNVWANFEMSDAELEAAAAAS